MHRERHINKLSVHSIVIFFIIQHGDKAHTKIY